MLADFYIPRLSNDMKIDVQKNHLGGTILYRSLDHSKKMASIKYGAIFSHDGDVCAGYRKNYPKMYVAYFEA